MLEPLGLDQAAERAYLILLQHPGWGAVDIAAQLGVSEEKARLLLDRLVDLSLVRADRTACGAFRAVRPQFGLPALLARRQAELHEHQQQVEHMRAAIASISDEYASMTQSGDHVIERLDGLENVRARLEEIEREARRECLSFVPGGPQPADALAASRPLDQSALERGVRLRSVYQDSCSNDPATWRYLMWLRELGADTRTTPTLPTTMVIVDRRTALIPLDPADARAGALQIHHRGIVATLCVLFEHVWQTAAVLGVPQARDGSGLSVQQQALLGLLGEGYTDERAARSLGLSLRTTRRMMSSLMMRLEAQSRFQAGVRAVEAGWLDRVSSGPGRGRVFEIADLQRPAAGGRP
ncbi:LuxR family transcriptional regulator [Nonomuraea sp. NPDC050153]|uniref:LuxR family transcriptional regulator n=1 Tax=Nonomuraea sp. NPDC050153 TaxID=3364359 RepID=UPI0037920732